MTYDPVNEAQIGDLVVAGFPAGPKESYIFAYGRVTSIDAKGRATRATNLRGESYFLPAECVLWYVRARAILAFEPCLAALDACCATAGHLSTVRDCVRFFVDPEYLKGRPYGA